MIAAVLLALAPQDVLRLERAGISVERDARVEVVGPIADVEGSGVLVVATDGVTLDLAGAELSGNVDGREPDAFAGVGIVIRAKGVTLRNARVSGYRVGILAHGADGLVLEDCDVSGNFRTRLLSTPEAENAADWLWPHANDGHEWRTNYGAGICIESSRDVTVRRSRARDGQNGLILDRVSGAQVYDNDFSFLSGWGIAMWRSSKNVISRNALDFCVRGYSHGVYNRGQDSAGLLMFEQCSDNKILENSITHGGDGVFGFAGKEALGEVAGPEGFDCTRKGCNDNQFGDNDLSFAVAHGLEMTFSFGNHVLLNRFTENAICGIWGGYSHEFLIEGNTFTRNGGAGYGAERGGVNIEHAKNCFVFGNRFEGNSCGVRLWWDEDAGLSSTPWAVANGAECTENLVGWNEFHGDDLAVQVAQCASTGLVENRFEGVGRELDHVGPELLVAGSDDAPGLRPDEVRAMRDAVLGDKRPVGARAHLAGREHILMTEWGPYDWERPLLTRVGREGGADLWRWLGLETLQQLEARGSGVRAEIVEREGGVYVIVSGDRDGALVPYTLRAVSASGEQTRAGLLADVRWS
ncbi:MAG TPA: right-handed parallel beta-helix repeat-containing protein, partial [Planctomycetota bacterium]|nr:right-handed parallel beta-helix repeat-containing protein [Planctomycetota bacterium]